MEKICHKDFYSRWDNALNKIYKGHIADVDGNLTAENEKVEHLSEDIINRIKTKIISGIPFGIASARSFRKGELLENIKTEVLKGLSNKEKQDFYIFSEQGTIAFLLKEDANGNLFEEEIDLVRFFEIVPKDFPKISEEEKNYKFNYIEDLLKTKLGHPVLKYKSSKKYGFLARIIRDKIQDDETYEDYVQNITCIINSILLENYPDYEAFCTRTSVYIAIKGATKELAIKFISHLYNLSIDEIVGTDDQGNRIGVGWSLTKHKAGFSTNIYDTVSEYQIPLQIILNKTGKEAWSFLDEHLTYTSPQKR